MPGIFVFAVNRPASAPTVSIDIYANIPEIAPILPTEARQERPLPIQLMGNAGRHCLRNVQVELQRVDIQAAQSSIEQRVADIAQMRLVLEFEFDLAGVRKAEAGTGCHLVKQTQVHAHADIGVLVLQLTVGTVA
ncbi:hypothetical protein D9M71_769300 [compost metagenome]